MKVEYLFGVTIVYISDFIPYHTSYNHIWFMCNCIRISGFIATKQSKHYEDQVNHYIQTDRQTDKHTDHYRQNFDAEKRRRN